MRLWQNSIGVVGIFIIAACSAATYDSSSISRSNFPGTTRPTFTAYTILHSFSENGNSAIFPSGTLLIKSNGNIFGTTTAYTGVGSICGCGAVFKLTPPNYSLTNIYLFNGGTSDGYLPETGVVQAASGVLYGTTYGGGKQGGACEPYGCGTVFSLNPAGNGSFTEAVLYKFKGGGDGQFPYAGLAIGSDGNLYGTTSYGGSGSCGGIGLGCGTVFKITPSGSETVLYSFQGAHGGLHDGFLPTGSLYIDQQGDLLGTTAFGGYNCGSLTCGTVFELVKSGGSFSEQILYRFLGASSSDGATPEASITEDGAGNIYGTTWAGGSSSCTGGGAQPAGCGTVFALSASGSAYIETVLANLMPGQDGSPRFPSSLVDESGTLFGVTSSGGNCADTYDFSNGCGTIFSTAALGAAQPTNITVLRSFQGAPSDGADPGGGSFIPSDVRPHFARWTGIRRKYVPPLTFGGSPGGGLTANGSTVLYGATSAGGAGGCLDPSYGCGTVYSFSTGANGPSKRGLSRQRRP